MGSAWLLGEEQHIGCRWGPPSSMKWASWHVTELKHTTAALWLIPGGSVEKNRPQCGRCRFRPWVGKIPGGGNGNLLQCSYLGNAMDRGAWRAIIHGVAKSWTQLSGSTTTNQLWVSFFINPFFTWTSLPFQLIASVPGILACACWVISDSWPPQGL